MNRSDDDDNATSSSSAAAATRQTCSDLRGEALTFKATSSGILSTLNHCAELMNANDEYIKKRLEKVGVVLCK